MPCHRFGKYPCGNCAGCYSSRSSDWSVRLFHELDEHSESSFITLTYAVDLVDVSKSDCQGFLKRLRRLLEPKRIRFFLVAEYGEKGHRPHYHAVIYGHDFSKDPGSYQVRRGLFSSPLLERAWSHGNVSSGSVTAASIRYVANYILGKEDDHSYVNLETGDRVNPAPVFSLMSRNPGIGSRWIDEHQAETYKDDTVQLEGFVRRPPRYYDRRVASGSVRAARELRLRRRELALQRLQRSQKTYLANLAPERRAASAKIFASRKRLTTGEL